MDTFILILRIFFLVIGSLIALFYLLFQFYQQVKPFSFSLTTADYIICTIVGLLFGFGVNNYYGLLAFVPLLLVKYLCRLYLKPKFLSGSGRWMEIDWKKLTPRGFERAVPQALLNEMNKMPKDTHFIIPKLYFNVFIYFIKKRMAGEVNKSQGGLKINAAQQNMAMGQFTGIIDSLTKLQSGETERKNFPFGMLRVTRL